MARILLIALDAFPPALLDAWCAEGVLPNLQRLRESGHYGLVHSDADLFPGSIWPTFFTSSDISHHATYHIVQWDSASRQLRPPTGSWNPITPFWHRLAERGIPSITLDVPFAVTGQRASNAVEVTGWGMHEGMWRYSNPRGLLADLNRRHGRSSQEREGPGLRPDSDVAAELPGLIADIERRTEVIEDLASRFDWQLLLAVFTEPHRGGHWFWGSRATGVPQGGLKRILMAFDKVLPRLEALLKPEDHLVLFSNHGMGPTFDADRLGEAALLYLEPDSAGERLRRFDLVYRLRHNLPIGFVRHVARRLPQGLHNWAHYRLWNAGHDWRNRRYVVNPIDHLIYVSLNQTSEGHASSWDAELDQLQSRLEGWTSGDGRRLADRFLRPSKVYSGPRTHLLPDLAIKPIAEEIGPIIRVDGVEHQVLRHNTRDGEHLSDGFYIQKGPGISVGTHGEAIPGSMLAQFLCEPAGLDLA